MRVLWDLLSAVLLEVRIATELKHVVNTPLSILSIPPVESLRSLEKIYPSLPPEVNRNWHKSSRFMLDISGVTWMGSKVTMQSKLGPRY